MAKDAKTQVATRSPKAGALTSWEQQMAAAAQDTAAAEAKTGAARWLSVKGGIMSLGGGTIPDSEMDVVVLDSVFENAYYEGDYDADNPQAPVCFAFSRSGEDMEPHAESTDKQHEDCATCPQNKWGSAEKGRGKACKNIRRLALMPATALESEKSVAQADWIGLKVPVTSVASWANYAKSIAASYKRPPFGMITTIKAQPHQKNQVAVTFQAVDTIKAGIGSAVLAKREAILEDVVQPYQQREEEPEQKAPARKAGAKRKY